jgi:alpha-galactosidase
VSVSLSGPDGWAVRATSPTGTHTLSPGRTLRTGWEVTAPAGTATGAYGLTLRADYRSASGTPVTRSLPVTVTVVLPPPAGTSYLSDLTWLSESNGWGPVERDTSNGERAAGDGRPITIGGTVYAKGLGVHAPSEVSFYTGRRCEAVTAQVGLDDSKGAPGTAVFEIWADGTRVAATGVLTNAMPAQSLTADVTGAQTVRLVVTDGGDGIDFDHADWADARLSC